MTQKKVYFAMNNELLARIDKAAHANSMTRAAYLKSLIARGMEKC